MKYFKRLALSFGILLALIVTTASGDVPVGSPCDFNPGNCLDQDSVYSIRDGEGPLMVIPPLVPDMSSTTSSPVEFVEAWVHSQNPFAPFGSQNNNPVLDGYVHLADFPCPGLSCLGPTQAHLSCSELAYTHYPTGMEGGSFRYRARFVDGTTEKFDQPRFTDQRFWCESDNDGVPDPFDRCIDVDSADSWAEEDGSTTQLDSDSDGYGNQCDGDFNNNQAVDNNDELIFLFCHFPEFETICRAAGYDMDGDGNIGFLIPPTFLIDDTDDASLFEAQEAQGFPGPSGLPCAGTVPCN